ncbi:amidohydrolase family protein [Sphingomonas sp. MMS24-JH45]
MFVDNATRLIERVVPKPLPKEYDAAFLAAQQILLADGVTAAADMGTSVEDWLSYRRMGDIGALRVRIMSYGMGIETATMVGGKGPTPWLYGDRLRMGGVKLYADGALGSRGGAARALFRCGGAERVVADFQHATPEPDEPCRDGTVPGRGPRHRRSRQPRGARRDPGAERDLHRRPALARRACAGDRTGRHRALRQVRHDRPSVQPVHQTSDRTMAEARLGEVRLAGAYAWRSLKATGAPLAFGTDFPVERPDPWATWAAAVTRADAQDSRRADGARRRR